MMYLYFQHSDGSLSLVAECEKDEAGKYMMDDLHARNPSFKVYYVRSWGDDEEGYTYDVSSHTEFYKLSRERLTES